MRRNMQSGRGSMNRGSGGSNRGSGPRGQAGRDSGASASTGPLMTEHLKLHDLDLELALLKRKREIIEQQQNMLMGDRFSRPSPFGNNEQFSQPFSEPTRFDRTSGFSHLYESSGSRFDRPQGTKRQAGPWEDQSPHKRFSGPQRPQKPNRPGPRQQQPDVYVPQRSQNRASARQFPKEPAPLMGHGFRPKAPYKPRKNFNPTKVTKPKPVAPPHKLNSLPEAERRNYVKQASHLVKGSDNKEQYVLLADKPVSKQLLGRLELALGSILKDLRTEYGDQEPHKASFKSVNSLRVIKQVIRERIKTDMLGKYVGNNAQVIESYRKKYPKETDMEILNLALEASESTLSGELAIKPTESENPETYFKINFTKLLSVKLDEMFAKLQEVYENDPANKETELDTSACSTDVNETSETVKEVAELNGTVDTAIEKVDEEKVATTDEKKEETTEEATEEAKTDNNAEESAEKNTETKEAYNPEEPTDALADDVKEIKSEEAKESLKKMDSVAQRYNILIDELLRRKLPSVLPRYKEHIFKILNVDMSYRRTKAAVVLRTNQKAERITEKNKKVAGQAKEKTPRTGQDKPAPRALQHFVKIIGKPTLPKRPVMRAFLDTFNPASIKKHRGIHNLLFVGFLDKADFDNILAANKSVIGNCTVEIKISEKFKGNKDQDQSNVSLDDSDIIMIEEKKETVVLDDSTVKIDEDLDGQITNLLSSIREEEEKANIEETPEENEQEKEELKETETQNGGKIEETETEEATAETEEATAETEEATAEEENSEKIDESNATNGGNKVVEELKNDAKEPAKGTPTRASSRIASTPSTIKTRRASKLGQN